MNEFEMIQACFRRLTYDRAEADGLQDDAAVLDVPEGYELVVSSDTLGAGTHFVEDETPENIAKKALRVNLSDMAAMGAKPYCYQLNIAFADKPNLDWVEAFVASLEEDQKAFDVFCSGGDTTVTHGNLHISMTMMGLVPKGRVVRRSGAQPGDLIVVTGIVGDAVIGVQVLLKQLTLETPEPFLVAARRPVPRIAIHEQVCMHAHAAIDISDGLIADLGHICKASGVSACIQLEQVPLSDYAQALVQAGKIASDKLVTGGDDYELILAVAPGQLASFVEAVGAFDVDPFVIGVFENGDGVRVFDGAGDVVEISQTGWAHF